MSKPPATEEQRFVTKALDKIVQLAPFGAITVLLIHLRSTEYNSVEDQDKGLEWVIVAILTALAGVWVAYAKSFTSTIREWAGKRGSKDAQTLIQGIEQVSKALKHRFTSANSRFAQAQGKACRDYLVEGLGEARIDAVLELNEVYVPLAIQGGVCEEESVVSNSQASKEDYEETQYIWDLLQQVKTNTSLRRVAIIAPGGSGKTTLLRFVAYRYGLEPRRTCREKRVPRLIPILLYLREYQDVILQEPTLDLSVLIVKHVLRQLSGEPLSLDTDWARALLQGGKAIVMMDGFDEVAADNCEAVSQWIDKAIRTYGEKTIFVLSSRPVGYARYEGKYAWMSAKVKPFKEEQRNDFLRRWYFCQTKASRLGRETEEVKYRAAQFSDNLIEQINQRRALKQLADNPLMLVMIATYHRFHQSGQLPVRRQRLYQGFINLLLEDRPLSKGIQLALPKEEGQLVLQNVALRMVQAGCTELSKAEMAIWVQQAISQCAEQLDSYLVNVPLWLQQLEEVSELLSYRDSAENYSFAHRSFQEYLAAAEIKRRQAPELLTSLKSEWRDTAVMYATQTNPTSLVEKLCDRADPMSLDIAYDCCLEYAENRAKLPDQILERIKELQYQQLEKSLSERDWKMADGRTYRIMLQLFGKHYGDYFAKEELLGFPCADLSRIDSLWRNYSDDDLGFSVQKEIYVNYGGSLDGEYLSKPYAHFFQAVGWCKKTEGSHRSRKYDSITEIVKEGMVRSYEDLTSEETPPRGSFPDMDLCATKGGGIICFIAPKLDECIHR